MAKKKEMTPEDKLAEALVPADQQPYEVPDNWCWTRLNSLYKVNPKNNADNDCEAAFIPMANIAAGWDNQYIYEIMPWGKAKKGHTQFADGDVAFAKISPCFENRKSFIADKLPNAIGAGTTELIILRNSKICPQFTYYLIGTDDFINKGKSTYSGTVGQQRIDMQFVYNYPVPLPPLSEQTRIVNRIESLFAKLDEAKEKIQHVLDGAELRKSAILHKAFTGELTRKWRQENGVAEDSWKNIQLKDIGEIVTGSTPNKNNPTYFGGEVPFIKPTELNQGKEICTSNEYLTDEGLAVSRPVRKGSTCVCCIGATISKCGMLQVDAVTNQQINTIIPYTFMVDEFVYYYCTSNDFKNSLISNASATTLPIINKSKMQQLPAVVPLFNEQQEIVRLLNSFLAKEKAALTAAEQALTSIDLMKKSILARVFRGQLGTNDPTEESSVELLKEILARN